MLFASLNCAAQVKSQPAIKEPLCGYTPKEGFVPDSIKATAIAEAVLTHIYGDRSHQRPVQFQSYTIKYPPGA
jgi:hypothetical protein